ncbi:MAG: hypothetical protein AB7T63_13050 [Planctomycetota bacterium]
MRLLPRSFENRLRVSAGLIVTGLLIALPTLFWTHAMSFMLFITVSGALTGLGVLVYLVSLLRHLVVAEHQAPPAEPPTTPV